MNTTKTNRYVMGWSQSECAWMVCYASNIRDAEELFENGEYILEDNNE